MDGKFQRSHNSPWHKTPLEDRIKLYEGLEKSLEEQYKEVQACMDDFENFHNRYVRIDDGSRDESGGMVIDRFLDVAGEKREEFEQLYRYIKDMEEQLEIKKRAVGIRLEHYREKRKKEKIMERDMRPSEFNFYG